MGAVGDFLDPSSAVPITIGGTNATAVTIGRAGIDATVNGHSLSGSGPNPTFGSLKTHITAQVFSSSSNDVRGVITLTTDATGVAANTDLCSVTFQRAFSVAPVIVLTPQALTSTGNLALNHIATAVTTTGFTITNGSVATGASAQNLVIGYMIEG